MSGAISFKPATRENVPLLIGLTAGTGGGKTYSALRIASGIAGPGRRFAVIDTERRRSRYYVEDFAFDVVDMLPPYSPARFLQHLRAAEKAGYPAVVVDSTTHEWAGEGGVLAMHDAAVERMAGANADWKRREALNWPAWREPKEEHRAFVEGLLQLSIPAVLCFRGKTGLKPGVDPESKKKVMLETPFKATTSDDLPFELTVLLVLSNLKPGTIDFEQPNKISKPVRPFIRDGQLLDEAFGAGLAAWARGESAAKGETPPATAPKRTLGQLLEDVRRRLHEARDQEAVDALLAEEETGKLLATLADRKSEHLEPLNREIAARLQALAA